ncbi:MAG: ornithine cyclodeaminase family protein [Bryobacteraceae bacterium]|nr:ornithine cyclodeaminase family protein [Bryobacteraceae bacterium]
MLHFTENDVRRLLPMQYAIERLRVAFRDYAEGRAQNQPRRRLILSGGSVLHSMAGAWGGWFGTKVYSTHPGHGAYFTFLLYNAQTAEPVAQFEANALGQIRTGAVSGLIADILLPEDHQIQVACIGTGFQAWTQLEALAAVRPLRTVEVFGRDANRRLRFAEEMEALLSVKVTAAESAEAAVAQADVVVTATSAKDPVLAEGIREGALVLAMGSNSAQRREIPEGLVRSALVVVDDKEACRIEAGDLLLAFADGDWDRVLELKNLVAGSVTKPHETRTIVFKSVGLGLEDVATAALVYERSARTTQAPEAGGPHHATH